MTGALFAPKLARALLAIFAAGLLVTVGFLVFGGGGDVAVGDSAGADGFSRSALGHRPLIALLEAAGRPVLLSRSRSAAKARADVPLLILEPSAAGPEATFDRLQLAVRTAANAGATVVVALPKWYGEPDEARPEWIAEAGLLPVETAQRVLLALHEALDVAPASDGEPPVRRPAAAGAWTVGGVLASALVDEALGDDAPAPDLPRPQLVAPGLLEPLLAADAGDLAGFVPGSRVLVIADPDLLNAAGLVRGGNAELALGLLVAVPSARALVVDEVLHGFELDATIGRALTRPPLVFLTAHALLVAVLLVWRVAQRFGRPLQPPPRLAPGKGTLIASTARLLAAGRRDATTLARYLEVILARAARRAGLGPEPQPLRHLPALAALAEARGARRAIVALADTIGNEKGPDRGRALPLAREVHAWYQETFDGAEPATDRR